MIFHNYKNLVKKVSIAFIAAFMAIFIVSCDEATDALNDDDDNNNIYSGTISQNTTWGEGVHVVDGCLRIENATLTIKPGAIVEFESNACMEIQEGGAVSAVGNSSKMIIFTGKQMQKGFWRYIAVEKSANANDTKFEYCTFRYGGGYSDNSYILGIEGGSPTVSNCTFSNSSSNGMYIESESSPVMADNIITECDGAPVRTYFNVAHHINSGAFTGNNKDYILVHANELKSSVEWNALDVPYQIDGGAKIEDANLKIHKGTRVQMASNSYFEIRSGGSIDAQGEENMPITIEGAVNQAGYWRYMEFKPGSDNSNNIFKYCNISDGGGYSNSSSIIYIDDSNPVFENCSISNSSSFGMKIVGSSEPMIEDNDFFDNTLAPLYASFHHVGTIGLNSFAGNMEDHILIDGSKLTSDATMIKQEVPWRITPGAKIDGAVLTVEPGTTIEFDTNGYIEVEAGSGLYAVGTPAEQITFTGALKQHGYWRYIDFGDNVNNAMSVLDHCIVEYGGGYNNNSGIITIGGSKPSIHNTTVAYSSSWGIKLYDGNADPDLENITYIDNKNGDINN